MMSAGDSKVTTPAAATTPRRPSARRRPGAVLCAPRSPSGQQQPQQGAIAVTPTGRSPHPTPPPVREAGKER